LSVGYRTFAASQRGPHVQIVICLYASSHNEKIATLNRQRVVDIARTTRPVRGDIADLEAYASGELTLEAVRAHVRVEERKHSPLACLFAWLRGHSFKPTPEPTPLLKPKSLLAEVYMLIGYLIAFCVFWSALANCWVTYGFPLGFGLGWLPAAILGMFAVGLWPIFVVGLLVYWAPVVAIAVGVSRPIFH
jgi:hypothetical protein